MDLFDIHCDTLYECLTKNKNINKNDLEISLEKAKGLNKWCQVFAIWIPDDYRGEKAVKLFDFAADLLENQIEKYGDKIRLCNSGQDIIKDDGKAVAIFSVEGGAAAAGTIEGVRHLHKRGVKLITLTWNGANEIGDGCVVSNSTGLTNFGRQAIEEMRKLNIIIDVSHLNDVCFWDVAKIPDIHLVASHSNSRTICKHRRNITDEQFTVIRNRGGLVGINFHSSFLVEKGRAKFSDILKHIDYFLFLGGEKTVCLGSDFDGGIVLPSGLDSIEKTEDLANYMLRHNYKEQLVRDIFYNNAANFFINALSML